MTTDKVAYILYFYLTVSHQAVFIAVLEAMNACELDRCKDLSNLDRLLRPEEANKKILCRLISRCC